jgi:hypothetical protein
MKGKIFMHQLKHAVYVTVTEIPDSLTVAKERHCLFVSDSKRFTQSTGFERHFFMQ